MTPDEVKALAWARFLEVDSTDWGSDPSEQQEGFEAGWSAAFAALSPVPDEQLDEIEKRADAATPGPWEAGDVGEVIDALRLHAQSWKVKRGKWNYERGDLLSRAADLLAALSSHPAEETEELLAYKPITADELDAYLRGSRPAEQELAVLVPVHAVARAVAALRATRPAEETGWEIKWAPVLRDGYEWAIRDEAECDVLIEEYADPAHWIYEDYNDDLEPVVGKRAYRRRKAGPWSPVPTDGGAT